MKTKIMILTFALCAAGLTRADQPTDTSASVNLQKKAGLQVANPFSQAKAEDNGGKIDRVGGMSSRPWTQIVGWHQGEPDGFMSVQTQESKLHVLWFGATPQP